MSTVSFISFAYETLIKIALSSNRFCTENFNGKYVGSYVKILIKQQPTVHQCLINNFI